MLLTFFSQMIAEILFMGRSKKKKDYKRCVIIFIVLGFALSFVLPLFFLFSENVRWMFVLYSVLLMTAFISVFFLYDNRFIVGLSVAIYSAFTLQTGRMIGKLISYVCFSLLDPTLEGILSFALLMGLDIAALSLIAYGTRKRELSFGYIKTWQTVLFVIGGSMLMWLTFFEDAVKAYDVWFYILYMITEIGCSTLLVLIQISFIMQIDGEVKRMTAESLNKKSEEQYQKLLENINVINIKAHDLKHRASMTEDDKSDLYDVAAEYDSFIRTGNRTLDVVLTEKSLRCNLKKILFTCVADGAKLDFMSEEDICSLFGNALDNAIECEEKFPEDKRFIDVKIAAKNDFVSVHIENYFSGTLDMVNGLPHTTKDDELYHGFGMKSMKMIVEKYKGNMAVKAEDDMFQLDIVFL